jgi:6,7-dimethyl-8-ribityllumazine synthase
MAEQDDPLTLPSFDKAPKVLLVVAPYYRDIAKGLMTGAKAVLDAFGAVSETVEVPGALEIPPAIRLAARHFDGFVALGCVLRGETTHYDIVSEDSSRGLMLLGVHHGLCIGNGILTCETREQALRRADPGGMDKGGGAAAAALHLIALSRRFGGPARAPEAEILLATGGRMV